MWRFIHRYLTVSFAAVDDGIAGTCFRITVTFRSKRIDITEAIFNTFAATYELSRQSQVPLTSILVIQYIYLSRTPAPQDITSWHLGKTKSYPGMALREKLAWQRTC